MVDDDPGFLRTIGDILKVRGFEPHPARTGPHETGHPVPSAGDAFLRKPFSPSTLLDGVRYAMRAR